MFFKRRLPGVLWCFLDVFGGIPGGPKRIPSTQRGLKRNPLGAFKEMDADGNGLISREEFNACLQDERVS